EMRFFAAAYEQANHIRAYFESQGLVSRIVRANLVVVEALIGKVNEVNAHREREQQAIILQEALSKCKQAVHQARQHNLREEVYKGHYLQGKIFALQGDMSNAARQYRVSIAKIEQIMD